MFQYKKNAFKSTQIKAKEKTSRIFFRFQFQKLYNLNEETNAEVFDKKRLINEWYCLNNGDGDTPLECKSCLQLSQM